jgi:hypothetical protein
MKALFLLLLFATAVPCFAGTPTFDMTGNVMLDKCRDFFSDSEAAPSPKIGASDVGFCVGYFSGVMDMELAQNELEKTHHVEGPQAKFCRPPEVTNGQVFKIVKKWLDNNPDKLHWAGEVIIVKAMSEAFPCSK